jgi:hypothetical protein
LTAPSKAQQTAVPPTTLSPANPYPTANPFAAPGRDGEALVLGQWLVFPSLSLEAIYDDNINQTETNRLSGTGVRAIPSVTATTDQGLYKTQVFGTLDERYYFVGDAPSSNSLAANAGFTESYEIMPDLVMRMTGNYTRQKDLFDTLSDNYAATNLNTTGVGLAPVSNPQSYNQFAGSASINKTWDRTFAALTGSAVDILYDSGNQSSPSPNGSVYSVTARAGQWFAPTLYAYAEGSADTRSYAVTALDSHGYRAVAGLGFDQSTFYRGEVYGGYQSETNNSGSLSDVATPSFGGRLSYHPLPDLILTASVDRSLGVTTQALSLGTAPGTNSIVTTSLFNVGYHINPEWSVAAHLGYIRSTYVGSPQLDNAWTLGGALSVNLWRNVSFNLDYAYLRDSSNLAAQNFVRNVASAGLSYRY